MRNYCLPAPCRGDPTLQIYGAVNCLIQGPYCAELYVKLTQRAPAARAQEGPGHHQRRECGDGRAKRWCCRSANPPSGDEQIAVRATYWSDAASDCASIASWTAQQNAGN
jgi:hypothetical protein